MQGDRGGAWLFPGKGLCCDTEDRTATTVISAVPRLRGKAVHIIYIFIILKIICTFATTLLILNKNFGGLYVYCLLFQFSGNKLF